MPGSNAAGLTLNPLYNGTTVTSILNPGQSLPNKVGDNTDYFFKVRLKCTATNLSGSHVYYNAGIASGEVGGGPNLIPVSDSTNCGDSTMVDPNHNGNASDSGENVKTAFVFRVLPVKFINITASLINKATALVNWQVATPMENAQKFEVEFSTDGRTWKELGTLPITDLNKANWQFTHNNIPTGYLYYRIKQTDKDGRLSYSRIVLLDNKSGNIGYVIYPNPASSYIAVSAGYGGNKKAVIQLYDAAGRLLQSHSMLSSSEEINTAQYPDGTYLLRIADENKTEVHKIIIKH